jgi:hypothetical protein
MLSIYEVYNKEVKHLEELNLSDLKKYREEIERASEILKNEEVRTLLLEVESIKKEDLEDITNELNDALDELKDLKELEAKMTKGNLKIVDALYADGLIKDKKKRINMESSKGELKVNGKKLPNDLKKKYRKLIQECCDIDSTDRGTEWHWSFYDK